jgi:hypothetical protein
VSDDQRDDRPDETEGEAIATRAEDEDSEPDFELHGQYFDAPSE